MKVKFDNWLFENSQEFVGKIRKIAKDLPLLEVSTPRALKNGTVTLQVDAQNPIFKEMVNDIYREWKIDDSMFKKEAEFRYGPTSHVSKGTDFVQSFFTTVNPLVYAIYYSRGAVRIYGDSSDAFKFSTTGSLESLKEWLKNHISRRIIEYSTRALDGNQFVEKKSVVFLDFLKNSYTEESLKLLKAEEKKYPAVISSLSKILMYAGYLALKNDRKAEFRSEGDFTYSIKTDKSIYNKRYVMLDWKISWKEKKLQYNVKTRIEPESMSDKKVWKLLNNPKNYKPVEEISGDLKNLRRAEDLGIV
jgi:hypothetical protein